MIGLLSPCLSSWSRDQNRAIFHSRHILDCAIYVARFKQTIEQNSFFIVSCRISWNKLKCKTGLSLISARKKIQNFYNNLNVECSEQRKIWFIANMEMLSEELPSCGTFDWWLAATKSFYNPAFRDKHLTLPVNNSLSWWYLWMFHEACHRLMNSS